MSRREKLAHKVSQRARDLLDRGLDRHIRLAVTGLSGAGKTALLTGILEQLLYANDNAQLPYLSVCSEQRLHGVRLVPSPNWSVARFDYESAIAALTAEASDWPQSTRDVSEIRVEMNYKPSRGLASKLGESRRLTLDLVDYPGEWLLDLPMLEQDYHSWSEQQTRLSQQPLRREVFAAWQQRVENSIACGDDVDKTLRRLAKDYQQQLQHCKQALGLYFLQPGRHLLPGALSDAPALDFFPWPTQLTLPAAWREPLEQKYRYYQEHVIKPFYKDYFQDFNRQVVLVDLLSALQAGDNALAELKLALNELMKSFDYGHNSLLKRLLAPKIDKVALVAAKADHVAPAQHAALRQLLSQLMQQSRQQLDFERIQYHVFAASGITVSTAGQRADGTQVLDGYDNNGQRVRLKAPDVPDSWPTTEQWQQGFAYPRLYPHFGQGQSPLPHMRLDQLLEYLLGDKLR